LNDVFEIYYRDGQFVSERPLNVDFVDNYFRETRNVTRDSGTYEYELEFETIDPEDPFGSVVRTQNLATVIVNRVVGSLGALTYGDCQQTYTVTVGTASGANNYQFEEKINDGPWQPLQNGSNNSVVNQSPLASGEIRQYRVKASYFFDGQYTQETPWTTSDTGCKGNELAQVNFTAPAAGSYHLVNEPVPLAASASDTDGTITHVEFFYGQDIFIAQVASAPYTTTQWTPTQTGAVTVKARATDNDGTPATVQQVINIHAAPSVNVTSPVPNASFISGDEITITANANDDGSVSQVEFLRNGAVIGIGTDNGDSTYTITWDVPQGNHDLTARVTDNHNVVRTSGVVRVSAHDIPEVTITSPTNGASFDEDTDITITASASDDGSIAQVQFLNNGTPIGIDTASPYSIQWTVPVGTHSLTTIATDDQGATSNSSPTVIITGLERNPPASAPANLQVTNLDTTLGGFDIQWDAVAETDNYDLQQCTQTTCTDADFSRVIFSPNLGTSFPGAGSGTYTYRVNACNDVGCSAWSGPITVTLALDIPDRPGPTYLKTSAVCSDGPTSGLSTGNVELCWDPVAGASVDHYQVQEKTGTGDWQTLVASTTDTELNLVRTTNNYSYQILACNREDSCNNPGGQLDVSVIDTPVIHSAVIECVGACINVVGQGFDASS